MSCKEQRLLKEQLLSQQELLSEAEETLSKEEPEEEISEETLLGDKLSMQETLLQEEEGEEETLKTVKQDWPEPFCAAAAEKRKTNQYIQHIFRLISEAQTLQMK